MDKDFQKMIAEKIHFIGANRYKIDTAPGEDQLLQEIDAAIDEAAANVTRETGRRISINEGGALCAKMGVYPGRFDCKGYF